MLELDEDSLDTPGPLAQLNATLDQLGGAREGDSYKQLMDEISRIDELADLLSSGRAKLDSLSMARERLVEIEAEAQELQRSADRARGRSRSFVALLATRNGILGAYAVLLYAVVGVTQLVASSLVAFGDNLDALTNLAPSPSMFAFWVFGWPLSALATYLATWPSVSRLPLLLCPVLAVGVGFFCHQVVSLVVRRAQRRTVKAKENERKLRSELTQLKALCEINRDAIGHSERQVARMQDELVGYFA
jgi:hypothetical protein